MIVSEERLAELLKPYIDATGASGSAADEPLPLGEVALRQLGNLLDLLLKWNDRTNLTAIRQPEDIVQRHFGESLFLARSARPLLLPNASALDFGSGAGFPGIPLQILYPELQVTLAESQGKKAAFLREAVRSLGLQTEVWAQRVEQMPVSRSFDLVAMRAVDNWDEAVAEGWRRVRANGTLALLTSEHEPQGLCTVTLIPGSSRRYLKLCRNEIVPRGTQESAERRRSPL